jgi:Tfp pilus assembly PilM family ATPase
MTRPRSSVPPVWTSQRRFTGDALRDILGAGRFKGRRVVASISAAHTYVQHLRLSRADGEALSQQIEGELRGRLPLDPAMLVVRHVVVGDVIADGANKQEVICLAASRDYVMRNVQMVRAAGYDVVGMHCEPMAIVQSFAHLFRRAEDAARTTLFVDIGAATAKALIAHGRSLVFAKTIHVAGDHFTRQLAQYLQCPLHEARLMRISGQDLSRIGAAPLAGDQGMPVIEGPPPGATPPAPADRRAAPVLVKQAAPATSSTPALFEQPDHGEMLEVLADELHLCIGYHDALFPDRRLDKVVFLGGEARQTRLCQRIAQALRLPAQIGDPLARVKRPVESRAAEGVDLAQPQPGWAVPLGLCLLPVSL